MSVEAQNWAFATHHESSQRSARKFVLVALADYADSRGSCYPSLRLLAEKTDMSVNTVRARLDDLVATGFIYRTGRVRHDGSHSANEYVLLMSEAARTYAAEKGWEPGSAPIPEVVIVKRGAKPASDPRQLEIFAATGDARPSKGQDGRASFTKAQAPLQLDGGGGPTARRGPLQTAGPHEPSTDPPRNLPPDAPQGGLGASFDEDLEKDTFPDLRSAFPKRADENLERARRRFDRLTRAERAAAVRFAPRFVAACRAPTFVPMIASYLRDKRWVSFAEEDAQREAAGKTPLNLVWILEGSEEAIAWARHLKVKKLFVFESKHHRGGRGSYQPTRWPPVAPAGKDPPEQEATTRSEVPR